MKKLLSLILLFPLLFTAQKKQITLEEIWSGQFREQTMRSFNPLNNDSYSLLNFQKETQSTSIDIYNYVSQEKTATLVDSKNLKDIAYFDDYSLNASETKILLQTNTQSIYRNSTKAIYYLYDIESKSVSLVDKDFISIPNFSPDNKFLSYVKNNNLYVKDIELNKTMQITLDGEKNKIINAMSDWVYEEELKFVKAYHWSLESDKIAFLKFDESEVPLYDMDILGTSNYPTKLTFKYPKAGENNSKVSLLLYDLKTAKTNQINLGDYEYIPNLTWTHKNDQLSVMTLNRHQNHLKLHLVDSNTLLATTVLEEKNDTYVDIVNTNYLTYLEDNSFIWGSEASGFNHLYHYSKNGKLKQQITHGNWEVTKYYGLHNKTLYYQSTEEHSTERDLYSIQLNGKNKTKLSRLKGTNDAEFSKDFRFYIVNHSNATTPTSYTLFEGQNALKTIKDNTGLQTKLAEYIISPKEFSTLKTATGTFNMWMVKPLDFDSSKKYPLVLFQYSGPGSQEVHNSWNSYNDYWHQILAQKGYIIACIDGRGTGFKGNDFKKITYKDLGKFETIDQIEAAKVLRKRPYIAADKIGIWGWSYGGFMAANCILKGSAVFSTAISIAPVTSWRFYDSIYTERFLRTPQENPSGYDDNSPIFHAKKLKGNLLIVHGTGDDNVHVQNTYQMTNALIKANKPFDQFIYPDRAHGIYRGKNTRLHLFTKMTNYLDTHLK
ncbi:S9 family peptidase [Flavicella sediminum]|uniref:S9 family peptidase n=1 Tax=Flavicella sediminum TaxID=2585141 RepID=UPI001124585B|nr:S9 family peptidase [Flavicella sediminum]